MLELLSTEFQIALAVATAAGMMRGFAGFGSGMLMAPIFAILFGPVETVAVIILMESVVTVQLMPGVRHEIDWRFVLPMGVAAMLLMPGNNEQHGSAAGAGIGAERRRSNRL